MRRRKVYRHRGVKKQHERKKELEIIKLLKSGNFTLHYYDNDSCALYKGIHKDQVPERAVIEFECESEGYLPKEVELLVKALGGESGTD